MDKIGILDPEGIHTNPLNGKIYSDNYKKLAKVWSKFPAYENANEIINDISKNQVTLIISGTGSGKTVLIPKYVAHMLNYTGKIAITLPKQIVTKSSAIFAAETLDVKIGEEVGYKFKGTSVYNEKTNLLYCTDGTVVQELLNDKYLKKYDAIIVDEIHERRVQIDFLLYLLRETLQIRPELKIILMSATVDKTLFESYFSNFKFNTINIGGKTNYPIEYIYLKEDIPIKEYVNVGYNIIKEIIKKDPGKDIIFFTPSIKETFDTCKRVLDDNLDLYCVEIYSGVPQEKEIFAVSKDKYKETGKKAKLIMGTSVAESSITFDNVTYCIDSGYDLSSSYDPEIDAKLLLKSRVTKAACIQRAGRVGRTAKGICYRLFTEETYNSFPAFPDPEIRKSNIYAECLKLISLQQIRTINKLIDTLAQFIEPPKEKYIKSALSQLTLLKLIDKEQITPFGDIISKINIDPMMAISIYISKKLECSREVISIMTLIEVMKNNLGDLFSFPKSNDKSKQEKIEKEILKIKNKFLSKTGDHLSLYKIMKTVIEYKKEQKDNELTKFCKENYLKKNTLDKAYKAYKKMREKTNITVEKDTKLIGHDLSDRILASIFYGFRLHEAVLRGNDYATVYVKNVRINRNSFFSLLEKPNTVVYQELFKSDNTINLNIVSKITKEADNIMNKLK